MTVAALYHRSSAAHGDDCEQDLDPLRRHAEARGWILSEVFEDRQQRPSSSRPGFDALCSHLAAGRAEVVMTLSLDRLFTPSVPAALITLAGWLGQDPPIRLVAITDRVDTTEPDQMRAWQSVVPRLRQLIRRQRAEAAAAGHVLRARSGLVERQVWDDVRLRQLYRDGHSQRRIAKKLATPGFKPAQSSVCHRLKTLRAEGYLDADDDRARAQAQVQRPLSKGGRPKKADPGEAGD